MQIKSFFPLDVVACWWWCWWKKKFCTQKIVMWINIIASYLVSTFLNAFSLKMWGGYGKKKVITACIYANCVRTTTLYCSMNIYLSFIQKNAFYSSPCAYPSVLYTVYQSEWVRKVQENDENFLDHRFFFLRFQMNCGWMRRVVLFYFLDDRKRALAAILAVLFLKIITDFKI